MRIRSMRSRLYLLFSLTFIVLLAFPAMALALEASPTGSVTSTPTIQSDQADYPPGATVTLTGSNWQPGESVHISVNDTYGASWARNVDVNANANGEITDSFNLPEWFVSDYDVTATGTQSGTVRTTFTDANPSGILVNPTSRSVTQGQSATYDVTVQMGGNSSNCTTTLSASGLPTGATASFSGANPRTGNTNYTSTMTISTTASGPASGKTPTGSHTFNVQMTRGSDCQGSGNFSQALTLVVNSANQAPVANAQSVTTNEDTAKTITLTGTDADGNNLTYSIVSNPSHGTLTGSEANQTYTPNANYNGSDSFTFKANDGTTDSGPATVSVTVNAVNDAPSFIKGSDQSVNEDSGVQSFNPWATSISKGPNDESTQNVDFVIMNNTNSSLFSSGPSVSPSGALTYTPATNKNGSAIVTLKIHDDGGTANGGVNESATQSFTITVNPVNDDPVANNDSATIDEDTNAVIDVLANDSDVDGDSLSVESFTQPSNGTVTKDPDGKLRYVPNNNFNGTNTFSYTVSDGHGGTATANVTVNVTPVNDAPVAKDLTGQDDQVVTPEDTPKNITLQASDVDSSNLTFSILSGPSHGSLSGTGENQSYTPANNYKGPDTFTFEVCDDSTLVPLCDEGTVDIVVTPVNDAPVANNDQVQTNEDETIASIPVLGNDSDVESDPLTAIKVTGAAHGTVTLNPDNKTFSYTPAADYNGDDSFTYKANDASLDSNTATVNIDVNPVNDKPVAKDDSVETNEDTSKLITLSATDVENDGLAYKVTSLPANGKLYKGDSTLAADEITSADTTLDGATLTYVPNTNYNGNDSFKFLANDGTDDSDEATVSIKVNPVNDAPVAKDDTYSINEDDALNIGAPGLLGNDTDVEHDALHVADSDTSTSAIDPVSGPSHGTLNLNANGSFSYTPNANYNGPDSFDYLACDNGSPQKCSVETAKVNVTVNPVNDAPVADDNQYNVDEDGTLNVPDGATDILGNDTDVENDTLHVADSNTGTADIDPVSGPSHGTLTLHSDGSFSYKPNADYHGTDSFTYRANDGTDDSNVATVTITVKSVNDAPVAANDNYSVNEDGTLTKNASEGVLLNDTDTENDSLSANLISGPSHGTLNFNNDGSFVYNPQANYNGPDDFTYKANDGTDPSNLATVHIDVNPVNDAPVADNDSYNTNEDQTLNIASPGVLGNDSDIDSNTLTTELISGPVHGQLTLDPNGSFSYTPSPDYNGPDSFTYKAKDASLDSNTATVNIDVNPVNDKPVGTNDLRTTPENTPLVISAASLTSNDDTGAANESSQNLLITEVSDANHGTVSLDNSSGQITFTPEHSYNGTEASFLYKLCDDGTPQECSINKVMVDISVTEVNDVPGAEDDTMMVAEDGQQSIDATSNDSAGPGNESTQTLIVDSITSAPSHGTATLNANGTIKYVPEANYHGDDQFDYKVCDDGTTNGSPDHKCAIGTVKVTVTPVNDAPVAANDSYPVDEDQTLTITAPGVLGNDSDIDGDSLTAVLVSGPAHGTLNLNANGSFSFTPAANYNGPDSFTYKANDGTTGSNVATVAINVRPVNDKPVAKDDGYNVNEDTATNLPVLNNDTDVDGDSLTANVVSGPSHGTLTPNANGFSYTPANNYSGPDSFTYKANDGTDDSNVATVTITVDSVNDNPVISSVTATGTPVDEGSPATIKVTANDPDTPAADLRYSFDCNGDGDYLDAGDKVALTTDSASCSFDDGTNAYMVNVRVTDGAGGSAAGDTNVGVRNVVPTITGIAASPQQVLVGQNVTFTGAATDPSLADTNYGFNWQWSKDGGTYSALAANLLASNPFVTSFNSCGQHSVSAKATDKDGGTSAPFSANTTTVSVSEGHFRPPLNEGMYNATQKGQIIPVKITVGCGLTNLTGLTPSIQLLNGDKSASTESGTDAIETYSVSSADTTGFMRSVDGGYLYNLAIPTSISGKALQAGDFLTIRVNPFGTKLDPNPAGSAIYVVLKIRK